MADPGQKQRIGSGDWERVTNKQQRRLVTTFNVWFRDVQKRLAPIVDSEERFQLFRDALPGLHVELLKALDRGAEQAVRAASGTRFWLPEVQELLRGEKESNVERAAAMAQYVEEKLMAEILR